MALQRGAYNVKCCRQIALIGFVPIMRVVDLHDIKLYTYSADHGSNLQCQYSPVDLIAKRAIEHHCSG
jgi:hypothetical protein